jgi:glycosyltransferase involved in cell wall biosynthesis
VILLRGAQAGGPTIRGLVDTATRERVAGWAQDPAAPDMPVSLLITADDTLLARVLADRPRADLHHAGIGSGRHAFDVDLKGMSPLTRHVIAVRCESNGAHLDGSPVIVQPAGRFDAAFQAECAALLNDIATDADLTERLAFLAAQTESLLARRAARRSQRSERNAARQIKWRWAKQDQLRPGEPAEPPPPRALVIDEEVPAPRRDAGSNAILSHMRSLQRLGFEVTFAAASMARDPTGLLDNEGIASCHGPWHGSVEEVLRREADSFDLVYLHRVAIATRYLGLVRFHQPKARVIYSVADLHHLRLSRQAQVERRPELVGLARQFQSSELRAAAAADAVVTHSAVEAATIRRHLPSARVHVVPWSVPPQPTAVPVRDRHGMAFIGHYGHAPNRDAARWLLDEILPAVRACVPGMRCLLVGSDMPDSLYRPVPGAEFVGQVESLSEIFDRVRLTIAPMTYGAGIKGKVLASLAAGIPCVCTPVAAEGLDLPTPLQSLIAIDAAGLAASIQRVHDDEVYHLACSEAELAYVTDTLSEPQIDALMRDVAALPVARPGITEDERIGAMRV